MTRKVTLRIRPGNFLVSFGGDEQFRFSAGDEIVVTYADAAKMLMKKGRRGFEIVEVFDDPNDEVPATLALTDDG